MFQKSAERWQTGRVLSVFADHLVRVHDDRDVKEAGTAEAYGAKEVQVMIHVLDQSVIQCRRRNCHFARRDGPAAGTTTDCVTLAIETWAVNMKLI